jgi:hypothetical protein
MCFLTVHGSSAAKNTQRLLQPGANPFYNIHHRRPILAILSLGPPFSVPHSSLRQVHADTAAAAPSSHSPRLNQTASSNSSTG